MNLTMKSKSGGAEKILTKKSNIEGVGCFAAKVINKNALICYMEGEEISIHELKKRYERKQERIADPLQVADKKYIDLKKPYVYINHSCAPNAAIIHFNELIALRDIKIGEEITFDYSATDWPNDKYWEGYGEWSMECRCGSRLCREVVEEWLFLPKQIQKKYVNQGCVQNFILKKYQKHRAGKNVI